MCQPNGQRFNCAARTRGAAANEGNELVVTTPTELNISRERRQWQDRADAATEFTITGEKRNFMLGTHRHLQTLDSMKATGLAMERPGSGCPRADDLRAKGGDGRAAARSRQRSRGAVPFDPLHRPAGGRGDRTFGGQRGRFLRRRSGTFPRSSTRRTSTVRTRIRPPWRHSRNQASERAGAIHPLHSQTTDIRGTYRYRRLHRRSSTSRFKDLSIRCSMMKSIGSSTASESRFPSVGTRSRSTQPRTMSLEAPESSGWR